MTSFLLWHVSVPIADGEEEIPIALTNYADAKKLRVTSEISEVFGSSPPKKTIHVIVQRCSSASKEIVQQDSRKCAVVMCSCGNSGLWHLESSKKDVVCTYATDNKLATVDQLRKLLHQHFEQFDGDDYVQIFAYQPGISKPVWLADDIVLRSCLEQAKENDLKNLTISLNSPAKSFSIYTWKEMMEQYRVGAGPEFPPSFDIQPRSMNDDEKIMLEEIVKECTRRNEAYISGPSSSEFTRNTIVDAFMVGAMQSYKADMFLA
ncbi:hypothetical protein BGX20_004805 [Mortierella sp. AD010]|nr:hypothetical protein BGX20_004805 [Mortierella sp. AD010]